MDLGIVVPCYNEEAVLPVTAERLLALPPQTASVFCLGIPSGKA
jgi:hypothetical protein